MAPVALPTAGVTTPVGYEYVTRGRASEALVRGNLVVKTGVMGDGHPIYAKAAAGAGRAGGIVLNKTVRAGVPFDVGRLGEMDGFTGLTPDDPLYPSATTAGGMDTDPTTFYSAATDPAVAVPAQPQIRAETTTRIIYNFMP